ncbi:MAG: type II secretion system F family protein [Candidatus Aenigmarchaeota archaeon]|nr:type II secretion system F family protein [Candidatus Aenigmarchaeota archaeon]
MRHRRLPLQSERMKRIVKHYLPVAESLGKMFPTLELELKQAHFGFAARDWIAYSVLAAANYGAMVLAAVFVVMLLARVEIMKAFPIALALGLAVLVMTFLYNMFYPRLFISRRSREIERNLPFALRQMLIQVRGGMPIYNSLASIAASGYGVLSEEFASAVRDISTGKSAIEALERITMDNPSLYFRRIMWQIVNALKTGADIGQTLKEIVDTLVQDQRTEIKKYGAQLNPLALFYMMTVVIFPTMGIIFLVILSSFLGQAFFDINLMMLLVLGFLFIAQFMFIGMVKSKRPAGI